MVPVPLVRTPRRITSFGGSENQPNGRSATPGGPVELSLDRAGIITPSYATPSPALLHANIVYPGSFEVSRPFVRYGEGVYKKLLIRFLLSFNPIPIFLPENVSESPRYRVVYQKGGKKSVGYERI